MSLTDKDGLDENRKVLGGLLHQKKIQLSAFEAKLGKQFALFL